MNRIIKMIIFEDDHIEIYVECGLCKNVNIHKIKEYEKIDKNIIIDFNKLGERVCDGIEDFKNPIESKCTNKYFIYP
ncbi:MAG: hypothetical protein CL779_02790 [Chloroflexi bacterium]|nr:hypothetical protein [Chloroflexota bacterium]